jgi:hypothetical protein
MYGARHPQNTQDGKWTPAAMPLIDAILGFDGTPNTAEFGFSRHPAAKAKEGDCIVLGTSIDGARQAKAMQTMYAMGIDIDSGASLSDVVRIIEKKGLMCFIHTSFNHGKSGLKLKRDEVLRKLAIKTDPTLEQIQTYLREHDKSRYEERFIQAVSIKSAKTQVKEGVVIELDTPPLDKMRLIFPLAEPVELISLAETHQEALDIWEDAVTGMAHSVLGVHFDTSCTDPSRLFYTARHPKGSENFYSAILRGDPLVFETIPRVKKAQYARNRDLNAFVLADDADASGAQKVPNVFLPSGALLNDYHSKRAKSSLMLADLLETLCPDKIRHAGGEKAGHVHTECPFEHEHSGEGGTGTMAVNALDSQSGYWTWFCHHDACQSRHKIELLGEAINRDWFPEEALLDEQFLLPPEDEPDEIEEEERQAEAKATAKGEEKPAKLTPEERVETWDDTTPVVEIMKLFKHLALTNKADDNVRNRLNKMAKMQTGLDMRILKGYWKEIDAELARNRPDDEVSMTPKVGDAGFDTLCEYGQRCIAKANEKLPTLFHYMERMVVIRDDSHSNARIKFLDREGFAHMLNNVAKYEKQISDKKVVSTSAPTDVVSHLYAGDYGVYPALRGLVTSPIFSKSGQLINTEGYHRESGLYYQPNHSLVVPPVSDAPDEAEVAEAVRLLVEEVYADFPLGAKSRPEIVEAARTEEGLPALANLISLTLLPFAREMIQGPTPGHLLTKPAPGTGASLLTDAMSMIATGKVTPAMAMPNNKDEMSKTLTSVLANGQNVVFFDNINHSVDSGELASAMTATTYAARILGRSETIETEVRCAWILTGNNVRLSGELVRRLVMIDLDARLSNPAMRTAFRHSDIKGWIAKNRGLLVWACLTLIQNWIAKGKIEQNDQVLASFESYSRIMGGILRDAGLNGFMGNRAQLAESSDDDADDVLQQLIETWWEECGAAPLYLTPTANPKDASVAALAIAHNIDLGVRKQLNGDGDPSYPTKPLANWLGRYKNRVFDLEDGQSVLLTAAPRSSKGTRWQLAPNAVAPVANVEVAA